MSYDQARSNKISRIIAPLAAHARAIAGGALRNAQAKAPPMMRGFRAVAMAVSIN